MHRKFSTKTIIAILALFTLCLNETEAAVTRNDRVPFDQLFFDSCTREFVRVRGEMHVLTRSRTDRRGAVYDDVQIDLRGQGAGLISRNPYVLSQRLTVTFDNPPGCGSKRTLKRTTRLISKGRMRDLHVTVITTFEENANCETTNRVEMESNCRGR